MATLTAKRLAHDEPAEHTPPAFSDVLAAKRRILGHVERTPLRNYPALDRLARVEVWVKHENFQVTGAFKIRGGINLVSRLTRDERARGVIAASTGNHGLSVATAAQRFGMPATICVPEAANPSKVAAIRETGAKVIHHGADFNEAVDHAESLATKHRLRYIHSGDEPLLIAGVATLTLEIFEDQPDVDLVLVPVGGGSGAAGATIVRDGVRPNARVVAVQSDAAKSAFLSWKERRDVESPMRTFAEGLATRRPFSLPQSILRKRLDDFVLVSDDEIRAAQFILLSETRTLVEAAGAATLAAALRYPETLAPKTAIIVSGANVTPAQLQELVAHSPAV